MTDAEPDVLELQRRNLLLLRQTDRLWNLLKAAVPQTVHQSDETSRDLEKEVAPIVPERKLEEKKEMEKKERAFLHVDNSSSMISGDESTNLLSENEMLRSKVKQMKEAQEMHWASYKIMESNLRSIALRYDRLSSSVAQAGHPASGIEDLQLAVSKLEKENAKLRRQVEVGIVVSSSYVHTRLSFDNLVPASIRTTPA